MKLIKSSYEILTHIGSHEVLQTIEKISRVCYKSEDYITADSATKFVAGLIKRDHCFDTQTEILTLEGWKKYYQLTKDDLFATISPCGRLEYIKAVNFTCYDYEGAMYRVESRMVDLLVTNKHKLYVCPTTTKEGRTKKHYKLIEAENLEGISHAYLKNCTTYDKIGVGIPLNVLKLLGFAIGDGYMSKPYQLGFHIFKQRKKDYLRQIFNTENIIFHENQKNQTFSISTKELYPEIFSDIYNYDREKRIPKYLLENMSMKESMALLDGLINSDGTLSEEGSMTFCTTSAELKSQFQQLCLHAGFSSNEGISTDLSLLDNGFNSTKTATKFSVIQRYNKPEINIGKASKGKIKLIPNWSGKVWCVEVPPYNTLYVRRNKKPVWSGNCAMIEHFNITVKFICCRGVSHEIVRHRLSSFAQESTRYVNYSKDKFGKEITFIEPSDFNSWDNTSQMTFRQALSYAEDSYLKFIEWGFTPQQARAILPNATKTELVMTANLREWRHFFKLRTAKEAHPDMRALMIPLLKELKEKLPVIFDDIEILNE